MSKIETIINEHNIKAAIFDLDGTMLDNNDYHLKSWIVCLKKRGMSITENFFKEHLSGKTNHDTLEFIFNRKMADDEAMKITLEKEEIYRELYKPYLKEVAGLTRTLEFFTSQGIKLAIATSGILPNINFMFDNLPVRKYFEEVVYSADIKKGKPDPEIYILTAQRLKTDPRYCLVFEDSIAGVTSGKSAGMKVVALTTTNTEYDLKSADYIVKDFFELF